MTEFFKESVYAGLLISLGTYALGAFLKKKTKSSLCNPLLIAVVLTCVIVLGLKMDFAAYKAGANILNYMLTPATVCFAIPLYEQFGHLKKNYAAVLAGILSGVVTSLVTVFGLCLLLRMDHAQYVTLLPKSITTAIGMGVSEELGGYTAITVTVILLTGVFGNVIADLVFKVFRIRHPIARGVALGTSAHAIGTSKAMELGQLEGAMSSLSLVVAGIVTVMIAPFAAMLL